MNHPIRALCMPVIALAAMTAAMSSSFASSLEEASEKKVNVRELRYDKPFEQTADSAVTLSSVNTTNAHEKRKQALLGSSKTYAQVSQSYNEEFWIYDSWVTLDHDIDYDGYYSRFTLEFDADTIYTNAPVYAVVYLGNNDIYDSIHVSSVFDIYGEDSSDSFVLENTLISGFPPQEYDLLIELYDAYTDTLVAFSDSYDDADLYMLSLESDDYEYRYEDTVVVVEEHGGSTGLVSLGLLLFITLCVKARRR
jgi:hypothetical protein